MNYILGQEYFFRYSLEEKLAIAITSAETRKLEVPYCLRLLPSHRTSAPHFSLCPVGPGEINSFC